MMTATEAYPDVWRSGLTSREVGFRAGYQAGFEKAGQGLVVTIPPDWRDADPAGLSGGDWQAGWRRGWVAGCEDGRLARRGGEELE